MVRRHDSSKRQFGKASLYVLATTVDLGAAAELLGTDVAAVEAGTYRRQLRRLFDEDAAAVTLELVGRLRVCPACISDRRFIGRETVLRLVHGCTEHGIWLRDHCPCGDPIEAFTGSDDPFCCTSCGRGWGELPRQPLGRRDWLRQRRVAHAYGVILERGGSGVLEDVGRVAAASGVSRWHGGDCLTDDPAIEAAALAPKDIKSVTAAVANLVSREIPPERILEAPSEGPHPELACRNVKCPTAGTSVAIRVSAHRTNGVESYCSECGTRYLGIRTIWSYDEGNGSREVSLRSPFALPKPASPSPRTSSGATSHGRPSRRPSTTRACRRPATCARDGSASWRSSCGSSTAGRSDTWARAATASSTTPLPTAGSSRQRASTGPSRTPSSRRRDARCRRPAWR
jgi:hypothetical protein